MLDFFSLPEVASRLPTPSVPVLTHSPVSTRKNFYVQLKFKPESHGQKLELFSAGYIDGHCKGVMVQGVFALLDYLEPQFLIVVAV